MLTTVGSRELKNRLGTYLRRVRKGETLRISDRGEVIAQLSPVQPANSSFETRLQQAALEGFLTLPKRKGFTPFDPIKSSGPSLSQTIIEDREDRF